MTFGQNQLATLPASFRVEPGDTITIADGTVYRVAKGPINFGEYRGPSGPEFNAEIVVEKIK